VFVDFSVFVAAIVFSVFIEVGVPVEAGVCIDFSLLNTAVGFRIAGAGLPTVVFACARGRKGVGSDA